MSEESPKTPDKVEKIPKEDSFKTAKTTMQTPSTKHRLRMTSVRISLSEGKNVFKEAHSSGKKFNMRTRSKTNASANNNVSLRKQNQNNNNNINDTAGSNETFIRCEQELMFDRDSLEVANRKFSSTPKQTMNNNNNDKNLNHDDDNNIDNEIIKDETDDDKVEQQQQQPIDVGRPSLSKQPTFLKEKNQHKLTKNDKKQNNANDKTKNLGPVDEKRVSKSPPKRKSPRKFKSPRKVISPKRLTNMPPPSAHLQSSVAGKGSTTMMRRKFVTPQLTYKKPVCLRSTASKYLDSSKWNSSRVAKANVYRSTAEIEMGYFNSLRSF